MKKLEERIQQAQSAGLEELRKIIRDPSSQVILHATQNRNLEEDMAVFLAKRKTTPPEALAFLASDSRFKDSYTLKLAICRNPKSPQKVTLGLLKFIRLFDLSDMTKDQHIPVTIRQKIEHDISQKISSLPSGVKIALARRANITIIMMLMEKSDDMVVDACLESPLLTEGHLYKIINKGTTKPHVLRMIAKHPKWSLRYAVKYALVRNSYTPMEQVLRFISDMKTNDLRDLHEDPKLPSSSRPFVYRELLERNETVEPPKDQIFKLSEEDDAQFTEDFLDAQSNDEC
ncbi:MAG: hypothetical protein ACM34I_12190 [bacterium]